MHIDRIEGDVDNSEKSGNGNEEILRVNRFNKLSAPTSGEIDEITRKRPVN